MSTTGGELSQLLLDKVREQIERTRHLVSRVPRTSLDWRPARQPAFTMGVLLGHLLECLAGLCAALHKANPQALAHFLELRGLSVNHRCDLDEAERRMTVYRDRIEEGFAALRDTQLGMRLPTVFAPDGEAVLTLLLGNLEHLINHKHQLFTYLKELGVPVATPDLYQFRGVPERR